MSELNHSFTHHQKSIGHNEKLIARMQTKNAQRNKSFSDFTFNGVTAVAAITFSAFNRYLASQTQADINPIKASAFLPDARDTSNFERVGIKLARAMISAAHASGEMTSSEKQKLISEIKTLGVDQRSEELLVNDITNLISLETLVNIAENMIEAAELYATSVLAIEFDSIEAIKYLFKLGERLKLPQQLIFEIEREIYLQFIVDELEAA